VARDICLADVIRQVVRPCFRFTLSFRVVEKKLTPRGVNDSYETIRCCDQGQAADSRDAEKRPSEASSIHVACKSESVV
jgi:transposase-like protein